MSSERERVAAWENWELAETLEAMVDGETLPVARAALQESAARLRTAAPQPTPGAVVSLRAIQGGGEQQAVEDVVDRFTEAAYQDRKRDAWRCYASRAGTGARIHSKNAAEFADEMLEEECKRFGAFEDKP